MQGATERGQELLSRRHALAVAAGSLGVALERRHRREVRERWPATRAPVTPREYVAGRVVDGAPARVVEDHREDGQRVPGGCMVAGSGVGEQIRAVSDTRDDGALRRRL